MTTAFECTLPIWVSIRASVSSRRRSASLAISKKCGWLATRHVSPSPSTNTAQTPKRPSAKWTVASCAVSASGAHGRSRESEAAATTAVYPSGLPIPTSGASRAASEDISRATADVVADDESDATRVTTTTIAGGDPEGLEHEADRDLEVEAETDTVDVVRVTADPDLGRAHEAAAIDVRDAATRERRRKTAAMVSKRTVQRSVRGRTLDRAAEAVARAADVSVVIDPTRAVVRDRPQSQSPTALWPTGKTATRSRKKRRPH